MDLRFREFSGRLKLAPRMVIGAVSRLKDSLAVFSDNEKRGVGVVEFDAHDGKPPDDLTSGHFDASKVRGSLQIVFSSLVNTVQGIVCHS